MDQRQAANRRRDGERQKSSTHRLKGRVDRMPEDARGVVVVLDTWARLLKLVPDPYRAVGHITAVTGLGLSYDDVDHLRQVRNCCAHPDEEGWPSKEDLTRACVTAYALRELTLDLRLT
jgi:hypothetical protein